MNAFRRALSTFGHFPRRYHGLVIGLLFWIIWMAFGFWRTILLLVLMALGYIVGRILEQNQSWRLLLDKLLSDRYTE